MATAARGLVAACLVACSAHEATPLPEKPNHSPGDPTTGGGSASPGLRLPEGVTPLSYELRLELDPDSESFHGEVKIRTRIDRPTDRIWLHADDLAITNARSDDGALTPLPAGTDQMHAFSFGHAIDHQTITLAFDFAGHTTKDEQGLFRQTTGNHWYLFSQGESQFARRITPCFDEPRFKTPWRVTLVVPDGQVALGNMPIVRERRLPDGHTEVELAETPPMPSYLLAVAVGPFEIADGGTVGRNHVRVRVAVARGDRAKAGIAAARLPAVVTALERYLDDPLPWPKLDLVAVPHLFGAMENPGLVTFDAGVLLGKSDQRGFVERFVHIAAHELAHEWFGNLVTPAWWNDLWLSEAFASWLSDKIAVELGAFGDATLRAALQREQALEADAQPGARSIRHGVGRNDDPDNAFDAIAYDKGAAVLSTFERWIGEDMFRTALRAYVRTQRDGVATTDDLIGSVARSAGPQIAAALKGYVDHAGAPIVDLALSCVPAPHLIAHARDISVPVCVRYPGLRGLIRACFLVSDRTELALATCPAWLVGNAGAGYFHVVTTAPAPPVAQLDPVERIALGDDVAAAFQRGDLGVKDALRQLVVLSTTSDPYAQHAAAVIARAIDQVVDEPTRPVWTTWLAARFAPRLGIGAMLSPSTVADHQVREDLVALLAERMPLATVRRARRITEEVMARNGEPEPDLVAIAAHEGGGDLFDRLASFERSHKDPEIRNAALEALGMFGPELVERALDVFLTSDAPPGAAWSTVSGYFDRAVTRAAAWHAVRARLPAVLARMSGLDAAMVVEATAGLCDPGSRAEVVASFEPRLGEIAEGRRILARSLASIDHCIAGRARAGDVASALP